MINFNEAISIINNNVNRRIEIIDTINSFDRVLSKNIYSLFCYPYFNNSAVDGYVFNIDFLNYDIFKNLFYIKLSNFIIYAGLIDTHSYDIYFSYEICTGAKVPIFFNTIVAKENSFIYLNYIYFTKIPQKGDNIRIKSEGFESNSLLLYKDKKINSLDLALLLNAGVLKIEVYYIPSVYLISTGSELSSDNYINNKISNSNGPMIISLLKQLGITKIKYSISSDNSKELYKYLTESFDFDIYIIIGGMSFGKYDLTRNIFNIMGVNELFFCGLWKPGKPFFFGKLENKIFFGLPGNPNSCYIIFKIFIEYFLRISMNLDSNNYWKSGFLLNFYYKKKDLTFFLHGNLINNKIFINFNQNSHLINFLANSKILCILFYNKEFYNFNDKVKYIFLS